MENVRKVLSSKTLQVGRNGLTVVISERSGQHLRDVTASTESVRQRSIPIKEMSQPLLLGPVAHHGIAGGTFKSIYK